MSVIVTDTGFGADDWTEGFTPLAQSDQNSTAIDMPADAAPEDLAGHLTTVHILRIQFPSYADGRGFTLARRVRMMGFAGRLRAHGHLIADQYAMARRSGFDEVEISSELAQRQPQDQWIFRADWQDNDYRTRLRTRQGLSGLSSDMDQR